MQDEMQSGTHLLVQPPAYPVLLSTDAPWQDILVVEQHRLAAHCWHESAARPYLLGLALNAPGNLDWRDASRLGDRTCQPPAGRCLFSMDSKVWWRQGHEADVVIAALDPAFVDRIATALSVPGPENLRTVAFTDPGIKSILLALRTELMDGCPSGRVYGESLAAALAARLAWLRERPSDDRRAVGLPSARLKRVLEYVDAHLAGDTSTGRLADVAGMSPRQFGRLFSQSTGLPPHRYVLRRRVARAKDLLPDSRLTLAEVGYRLGFTSQSHFTTTFRDQVGVTPSVFRKTRGAP